MAFEDSDFVSIDDFPLKWRWTDERYALLGPVELAAIHPLHADRARAAWEKFGALPKHISGAAEIFEGISVERDDYAAIVRAWLTGRIPQNSGDLLLFWNPDTGALVDAGLFVRRWDDFWYPSSDDL